jgi:hypothetical protein
MAPPLIWSECIPCVTTGPSGAGSHSTNGHVNPTGKGLTPVFSPSGLLIAAVVDHTTIVVRDSESFDVVSYLQIPDVPSHIEFDPTGSLLLVCIPKRSCVSVYPLQGHVSASGSSGAAIESSATLTESLAGVTYATWVTASPTTVLVVSDFACRMVAWDVTVDKGHEAVGLACPKVASGLGVASSPDGSMLGVLTRAGCKDRVLVYETRTFEEVASLELDTADAAGMTWSPDSRHLVVWDGVTYGPRVVVLGVSPGSAEVVMDTTWIAGISGLGVRTVAWSPSGSVLAVGTYDADTFLVNCLTWKRMDSPLHHGVVIDDKKYGKAEFEVEVFEETSGQYVGVNLPVRLPVEDPSTSTLLPATGTDRLLFSGTGRFLATVCADKPSVLWIWDASRFELDTVMVHRRPIRDVAWQPGSDTLYLVCGTKEVFCYDDGAVTVLSTGVVDERFKGLHLNWSRHCVALSCGSGYTIGSCHA